MIKHSVKRGDTLIEVMLAVGIFSMVAVAVVAVMTGGTSSSQTALETTLAREEIDNQAEILRFIHRSYIADKNVSSNQSAFGYLWEEITKKAVTSAPGSNIDEEITKFHPETCQELYDSSSSSTLMQNAFIIDPNQITNYEANFRNGTRNAKDVLIAYNDAGSANKFRAASTYPHLIYANNIDDANNPNNTTISDHSTDATGSSSSKRLFAAEGIFVNAVKDPNSTTIADKGSTSGKKAAYYDFYIRTCWYGTGDQSPSTVSTVIRLYNPDITTGG